MIQLRNIGVLFATFLCVFATFLCVFATMDGPVYADTESFYVDAYVFYGDGRPEVEVSIAIPVESLSFEETDGEYTTSYRPELLLSDDTGTVVKRLGGDRTARLGSVDETRESGRVVQDVARFNLDPGSYQAELTLTRHGVTDTRRFRVNVPAFERDKLQISGIQLVRAIDPESVTEPDRFTKLGHVVLPAADRRVESRDPLRWYVETYGIGQVAHEVRAEVVDRFGHPVLSNERSFGPYRDQAEFLDGLALRLIPDGRYVLRITVEAGGQTAIAERTFEKVGSPPDLSPHFNATRQSHVRALIAGESEDEARRFDGLNALDRAAFAYGFWRESDPYFATAYVGPLTGLARHEVRLPLLHALKHQGTLKKRVDKSFGERLPEPDTLRIRVARDRLRPILEEDDHEPFALTADALLALEAGYLAEGEFFAKRALKGIPRLADAANAIGLSKVGRGDWDDAYAWFDRASDNAPGWATPKLNAGLARFLSGKGNAMEELDAIRKASLVDETHPDVFYIAGRLLERRGRLEESANTYRRQIEVNPQHARARFDLGRVLYRQGKIEASSKVWRELMDAQPEFRSVAVGPALDAYIRSGETGKAQALISDELRSLDDEARRRVEDLGLVAGPEEQAAYDALPEEDQPAYVRAFWQKRDPTPATPGNERLVEHYRRVVYALHNFPSKDGGWDKRGDVYIRYGEPAHISRHDDIRFETDAAVIRVRERLMRGLSSEAREEIIARAGRYRTSTRDKNIVGEYGQQVEFQDFESIDFEMNPNRAYAIGEQDNSNRYVRGTEEATYRGRTRERPIHGIPLFPVDGGTAWEYWIYPDIAGGIEVVFTSLTPGGEMGYPAIPMGRELARFNEKFWDERRPELVVTRAKSQQPDRYQPPEDALDFHFATADFRGIKDRSRLEIYYGVPVGELASDSSVDSVNVFERGVALFDSTWTPLYRNVTPMGFDTSSETVAAGTLAIDEVALQLKPGRYYLGVQVNHPTSKRWNGYTQELVVEPYPLGTLGLSDIEIAGQVEADDFQISKGGLRVLPMPSRTFNPGQPVLIYYEIYGLAQDTFGQTKHRVDYKIRPRKGKLSAVRVLRALGKLLGFEEKAIVTISYERVGSTPDEKTYLEIDPGESKEGVYELTVTVTDMVSEQVTEKTATFLIGE